MTSINSKHETSSAPAGNALLKHPEEISASSWRRITVAHLAAGQPRPYADSVYEADICFEGGSRSTIAGYDFPFGSRAHGSLVRDIARLLVHDFTDEGQGSWADPRLTEISCIEQGATFSIWRVKIVQPYTD